VERGFLNLGDLRDTLARNFLKMHDLRSVGEFLLGDQLLHLDSRLAELLDGVYRRGPIYLRWLQRISAAGFGTPLGRWLVLYLILPIVGAFTVLTFLNYIPEEIGKLAGGPKIHIFDPIKKKNYRTQDLFLLGASSVFLLGLLHWPAFRRKVGQGLYLVWRGLDRLSIGLPRWLFSLPILQRFLASAPVRFFLRYLLVPLILSCLLWLSLWLFGVGPATAWSASGGLFLFSL